MAAKKTTTTTRKTARARVRGSAEAADPGYLLLRLYQAYEPFVESLWPWEARRWEEFVFCILDTVSRQAFAPAALREVAALLGRAHVLEIDRLGGLDPAHNEADAADAYVVTITTVLRNAGFTDDEAGAAAAAICEAAAGFKERYEGKVQKYLRDYGELMLGEIGSAFAFSGLPPADTKRVFAVWLQNVLNMPLACPDAITDQACQRLQVDYGALVKAADEVGVNVALLDNVLRAYWERDIELGAPEESQ